MPTRSATVSSTFPSSPPVALSNSHASSLHPNLPAGDELVVKVEGDGCAGQFPSTMYVCEGLDSESVRCFQIAFSIWEVAAAWASNAFKGDGTEQGRLLDLLLDSLI